MLFAGCGTQDNQQVIFGHVAKAWQDWDGVQTNMIHELSAPCGASLSFPGATFIGCSAAAD
jgi:hypothetical protein